MNNIMQKIAVCVLSLIYILSCNTAPGVQDVPEGVLVSVEELRAIRSDSAKGREPHATNVTELIRYVDTLNEASKAWPELSGEVVVHGSSSSDPVQLGDEGGKLVYGLAIAWHITGKEEYAWRAREMILDLTDTYGYRDESDKEFRFGSQGILNLARGGTPYIYAADLLEGWHGWTEKDKLAYQEWLRDVKYTKVAWASRFAKNNWGVAGSFSSALIAWYLRDHPDWLLEEVNPYMAAQSAVVDFTTPPDRFWLFLDLENVLRLTPREAFESHNAYQIGRMQTTEEWRMDAVEDIWGIQKNGAIPDEIRRGPDPVDGDYLPSEGPGTNYTMTSIEHLTAHAEFLRRRGDSSIFDHVAADGSGSLLQAYRFVIDNPLGSHCFSDDRQNALHIAYHYYGHPALLRSMEDCGESTIGGQRLALYARLTHPVPISKSGVMDGDMTDGDEESGVAGDVPDGNDTGSLPFDWCHGTPPDRICYSQRRAPGSDSMAMARAIADRYIDLYPAADLNWRWENTVLMVGIYELYRVTGEQRYLDYLRVWIDKHIEVEYGYVMWSSDSMSPAQAAAFLYFETGDPKYQAVVDDALHYLDHVAKRTDDGGISHKGRMGGATLWVDSLFMFGGLLTRWGEHTGSGTRLDEMGHQLRVFSSRLQSAEGLFLHACCTSDPVDTDVYWGRGNGWVTASGYDYLRARRVRGEVDDVVRDALARQVEAAVRLQDLDSGLWWIVLNRPGETYLETSTGALFAYGMARGWRYGFLDDDVLPTIALAMKGVRDTLTTDAADRPVVSNVSSSTAAGTFEYYKSVKVADDLAYGVGAVLLALVETSGLP